MSGADGNVKSTLKKPLICAEWTAVVPSESDTDEYGSGAIETSSPKFYLNSVQWQFRLYVAWTVRERGTYSLYLDVVRSDELKDIIECFRCTVIAVSEGDLQLPPPSIRKCIDIQSDYLWQMKISYLEYYRVIGKTISFLVVLEQDEGSTQEEADCNWSLNPKSLHSLCRDFAKLLDDPQTADVKLLCGDLTIPAHKTILSARSEVFQKMLQTDMVEKRTGSIEIPDIKPQTIKEFLRYIYSGTLPDEMTVEQASRLYETGDKYNVRSLVAECGNYLGSSLTKDNVCDVLVLADNRSDPDLRKRAIGYIARKEIPLETDIWKKFSNEHPKLAHEAVLGAYEFLKHNTND